MCHHRRLQPLSVEVINSTSASAVIPVFYKLFSFVGTIPTVIRIDNGPPFNGQDWANFAEHMGFKHRRVTPLWPRENGEAERFMRTVMKGVRIAHAQGKTGGTSYTSSCAITERLHTRQQESRHARSCSTAQYKPDYHKLKPKVDSIWMKEQRDKDQQEKCNMTQYADTRNNARSRNLTIGDSVLVKQPKTNKFSSYYDSNPFKIVAINGSMITAARDNGKTITGNYQEAVVESYNQTGGRSVEHAARTTKQGGGGASSVPPVQLNRRRSVEHAARTTKQGEKESDDSETAGPPARQRQPATATAAPVAATPAVELAAPPAAAATMPNRRYPDRTRRPLVVSMILLINNTNTLFRL